jgi:glutathione S-transferase
MKLYYSTGACSLAPHICLREAGLPFELVKVDTKTHRTEHGGDFYAINPKGYVPVLELDSGERLTEVAVLCQYVADLAQRNDLVPPAGTLARYRVMEWLSYVSSELHKSYSPLFSPEFEAPVKAQFAAALAKRYAWVDTELAGKPHLTGETFTAADAYLFTVTRWAKYVKVDLAAYEHVRAFMDRVLARPAVRAAMQAEGMRV